MQEWWEPGKVKGSPLDSRAHRAPIAQSSGVQPFCPQSWPQKGLRGRGAAWSLYFNHR